MSARCDHKSSDKKNTKKGFNNYNTCNFLKVNDERFGKIDF